MMLMPGIQFDNSLPVTQVHSSRMDVACFMGLVPMRLNIELPESIKNWLEFNRWHHRVKKHSLGNGDLLENVPVPIESWDMFNTLFSPEKRLDRYAQISSAVLNNEINITQENKDLYIVVDNEEEKIEFETGVQSLESIVVEINNQQSSAEAYLTPADNNNKWFLVMRRKSLYTAGSINVFQNESLGFNVSRVDKNSYLNTYLGSTVKAFFQQGGKLCYVVRMGDPLVADANIQSKINKLSKLLFNKKTRWGENDNYENLSKSYFPQWVTQVQEQDDWNGLAILSGLLQTSYLSFPDFPDLFSTQEIPENEIESVGESSGFYECVEENIVQASVQTTLLEATRCSEAAYYAWAKTIEKITNYLQLNFPETQLIASIPLPSEKINKSFDTFFQNEFFNSAENSSLLNSDHLQLAYPWLKSYQSNQLPSGAELPEGRLMGLLAKNALQKGAYFSVAGSLISDVYDLYPAAQNGYLNADNEGGYLAERISLFYPVVSGISLLSDVTPAKSKEKQYALVKRLGMYIRREIRELGNATVFEPNSRSLWNHIERTITQFLLPVYQLQVLKGKTQDDAFSVRCDKSTMTSNDINNGRVIAQIIFQPALPIEKIVVSFSFDTAGKEIVNSVQAEEI